MESNTRIRNLATEVTSDFWRLHPSRMASELTGGTYHRYKHVEYISKILAPALHKGGARIIVELPPRHGKSWLISKWTPAWYLSWKPHHNVLLASYEADFAASWGRAVRNQISETPRLNIGIRSDSNAADRWDTTAGGGMFTAGIGGPLTGRGGNLLLVDDYCKNAEQADSPTYRQRAIEWWRTTFYTRAEPDASIVILSTRWHDGDLIGYLLSEENETRDEWTRIRLPAIAEEKDLLGRPVGEALCRQRYDEESLDKIRRNVGTRSWNALYQQRPAPEQGSIVKREWWKFYNLDGSNDTRQLPGELDTMIQAWDLTFTDSKTSDFVVGVVWAKSGADYYLIDMVRGRMSFTETIAAIQSLSNKWPQTEAKYVEQAANGFALIDSLKSKLSGLIAVKPLGSKIARANAVSPRIESGNVWLPHSSIAPWVSEIIEEWASFPMGTHDDIVDAMCHGLQKLGEMPDTDWLPVSITGTNKFGDMSR